MNSYVYPFLILIVGFAIYLCIRDYIFDSSPDSQQDPFEPAPTSIEIRNAPLYPERNVSASGPNSPNQAAPHHSVTYGEPVATDPYYVNQEVSDHPEQLRHPENAYRSSVPNQTSSTAVSSGIASARLQTSNDASQHTQPEFIQGGGEFMPGIFANDTFSDQSYSSF